MINDDIESGECLDLVRFRVSEYIYVCHKSTILKYPESKLAELIKPENDKRKSGSDVIVINRDGKIFGTILKLMRDVTAKNWDHFDEHDIDDIMYELDFLQLACLKECVQRRCQPLPKPLKTKLRTLNGDKTYNSFDNNTIVLESKSVEGLNEMWQKIIKKVLTVGQFDICINDLAYESTSSPFSDDRFRFYLSTKSYENDPDFPPKLLDLKPDDFKEEFFYSRKYEEESKKNFVIFLIAIEMFMRATKPGDLVDIEKRIPGVRFRRYPMPEEAIAEASNTDELPEPSEEESGSESE